MSSISAPALTAELRNNEQRSNEQRNKKSQRSKKSRRADAQGETGLGSQTVSLLALVEEENKELRRAVIDLALDTLLLKEAMRKR